MAASNRRMLSCTLLATCVGATTSCIWFRCYHQSYTQLLQQVRWTWSVTIVCNILWVRTCHCPGAKGRSTGNGTTSTALITSLITSRASKPTYSGQPKKIIVTHFWTTKILIVNMDGSFSNYDVRAWSRKGVADPSVRSPEKMLFFIQHKCLFLLYKRIKYILWKGSPIMPLGARASFNSVYSQIIRF